MIYEHRRVYLWKQCFRGIKAVMFLKYAEDRMGVDLICRWSRA